MGLFLFECRKIFLQKGFAVMVVLCACLNLFLLNHSVRDPGLSCQPEEYRRMEEELRSFPPEEAYRQLSERKERLQKDDVYLLSEQEIETLCPYTGELWDEKDLIQTGMEELEHVMGYDAYLEKIQEDAQKMLGVSIFRKNSDYSVRNLEKTAEDFQRMKGLNLCFDTSQGITWATGFLATDLLGILLLFAACIFLILNEKQNHQLAFVVCTARGRRETGTAKIAVLFFASLLVAGILYAENFVYTGLVYGFGDWDRLVQSVPAYHSCILKISVLQYFLLFFCVKVLVYFVFGLLAFGFCLRFRQLIQIFGGFLAMIGLEVMAWNLIPVNSPFSALRYLNLFYFLQTDKLLMNYQNVNLFSRPVGSILLAGICLVALAAACIYGILREMCGNRILAEGRREGMLAAEFRGKMGQMFLSDRFVRGITGFEYLKIVQKSGGLLLIFFFLLLQLYRVQDDTYLRLPEQIYYRTYMNYLSGPLKEETADYVAEENERYASLQEQFMKIQLEGGDHTEEIGIMEKLDPYTAWEKVNSEYEQLLMRQEESGQMLSLVYGDGYKLLDGEAQGTGREEMAAFFLSLLLVLLTAGTFSCDCGQGMNGILGSTSRGKRETLRAKKKIVCCLTFICFLLVYGADFLNVYMKVGVSQFTAPVQSLFYLSNCRFSITLGQYLILLYFIRLTGTYVVLYGILAVSLFCGSTIRSMLVSSVLFLLPSVLELLQVKAVEKVMLLPLLTGGAILKSCLAGEIDLYMIGTVLLSFFIFVGSSVYMKRVFRERMGIASSRKKWYDS